MTRRAFVAALAAALVTLLLGACSAADDAVTRGRTVFGDNCSSCHGAAGEGGVGPALAGVLTTWPACSDHIEWVTLGSEGWKVAHGGTYGATSKPIVGTMPGHADILSADEIAEVAAYERIRFGGADRASVLADCGLPAEE